MDLESHGGAIEMFWVMTEGYNFWKGLPPGLKATGFSQQKWALVPGV